MPYKVFDEEYERYDAWYRRNHALFLNEVKCIEDLLGKVSRDDSYRSWRFLEVGVGTGAFASLLGVGIGLDPATNPLRVALSRGVEPVRGLGEFIPFRENVFQLTLIVVTLCFADRPQELLEQAYRVTSADGVLITCIVPKNSFLGINYLRRSVNRRSFYKYANFYSIKETIRMIVKAGFAPTYACKTLKYGGEAIVRLSPPSTERENALYTEKIEEWGFYCVLSKKVIGYGDGKTRSGNKLQDLPHIDWQQGA